MRRAKRLVATVEEDIHMSAHVYVRDVRGRPNLATNLTFTQLSTEPTTLPPPDGRTLEGVSGLHAHSQYPQMGDNQQLRITGYNIAAVVAGTTPIPDK
ncbi:hypothetical protein [Mycolicibacterium conceptionense]|uniref:hypothetical protein n=2 Tax=Mycobacteriaceae TaxID=1762 RepID=UPI0007EB998D|nr:hypothetical protein [Mycolicibacterium conceptionense]